MSRQSPIEQRLRDQSISVLLLTRKRDQWTQECLKQVCRSVRDFSGHVRELILVVDRDLKYSDFIWDLKMDFDFIKIVTTEGLSRGAPRARALAIQSARFPILLFTEEDCRVPDQWANQMTELVILHKIVTGRTMKDRSIHSKSAESFEEEIDLMKAKARTIRGGARYISFNCLGILKSKLPRFPFDSLFVKTAEDLDLSYRLIFSDETIFDAVGIHVQKRYPQSFWELILLKWKQAQGVMWVHRRLGEERLKEIGITSWQSSLKCWIEYSWSRPMRVDLRVRFLMLNLIYCLFLYHFWRVFRGVQSLSDGEWTLRSASGQDRFSFSQTPMSVAKLKQ